VPPVSDDVVIVSGVTTVRLVLPVIPLCTAEMVVLPALTPVARPAPLMVATLVAEEAQVTWLVRFCVLLSEYVPVAVNCCVTPEEIFWLAGVTAMEDRVADACIDATTSDTGLAELNWTVWFSLPVRVEFR
jgi:hypothetical protein